MKIQSIWLGSWFPKTSIHFQELVNFLENKLVIDALDPQRAKILHKKLTIQHLEIIEEGKIKCIKGISGIYEFRYYEDGLLSVNSTASDYEKSKTGIENFYHQQLVPVLSYLYSLGAKGLEIIRTPGSGKKIYLCAEGITTEKLKELFSKSKYQKIVADELRIFVGDFLTIIEEKKQTTDDVIQHFINYDIFYSEVKKHANALLQTHRFIWDNAEQLIKPGYLKASLLFSVSQQLATYAKDVGNIQSRIEQIQLNIDFRKNVWHQYKPLATRGNLEALSYLFKYLENIFTMTKNNLQNNAEYLSSAYNERQQNLLNRLQFLFLIGVVVAFITLGAFPGAKFIFYDLTGQQIASGDMISFDLKTLLVFGSITIVLTLIILAGWIIMFKKRSIEDTQKK